MVELFDKHGGNSGDALLISASNLVRCPPDSNGTGQQASAGAELWCLGFACHGVDNALRRHYERVTRHEAPATPRRQTPP
jgi:hypothetical protein